MSRDENSPQRALKSAYAMLCAYWLVHVVAMHIPLGQDPNLKKAADHFDKLVHFAFYGGFAFVLVAVWDLRRRLIPTTWPDSQPWRYALVAALMMLHALIDEVTQPWTGRKWEWSDFAADFAGVVAFLTLWSSCGERLLRRFGKGA